jgi:hypothetical protein
VNSCRKVSTWDGARRVGKTDETQWKAHVFLNLANEIPSPMLTS